MNKAFTALILGAAGTLAAAHEGHGLPGTSHWHASDAWLGLALAAAVAVGVWLGRRK